VTTDLATLGRDLDVALTRRHRRLRRRRKLGTSALAACLASFAAAAAFASSFGDGFSLDPTEWSILGGGSVDGGRGAYVHAQRTADGSPSTFLVEHDAGLPPYEAFLLHERTLAAAQASSPVAVTAEPGDLCTPAELTRAEQLALAALRSGASADAAVARVRPCRGLAYAVEQAQGVHAGTQPATTLMPGVD
jgi:hypothetical protein